MWMEERVLQYTMMTVFITVIVVFLTASLYLIREIARTPESDRPTESFRIEVVLLVVCLAGFVGSLVLFFTTF